MMSCSNLVTWCLCGRRGSFQERPGHTLQTSALVNEAYLRLIDQKHVSWQNRAHFFAACTKLMRQVLVDYVRGRRSAKREGEAHRVCLEDAAFVSSAQSADLVALDDALQRLEAIDPRKSQVIELRFFGGLTIEDTAEVLQVSHATVEREWSTAQAWLYREINLRAMY